MSDRRLTVVAAARTGPNRDVTFGGHRLAVSDAAARGVALATGSLRPSALYVADDLTSRSTAEAFIGWPPAVSEVDLAGPDFGHWTGRTPEQVGVVELRKWFADTSFRGHGGESVDQLTERVGRWLDRLVGDASRWRAGAHAAVVATTPVVQAMVAITSGRRYFDVEVAPASVLELRCAGTTWAPRGRK